MNPATDDPHDLQPPAGAVTGDASTRLAVLVHLLGMEAGSLAARLDVMSPHLTGGTRASWAEVTRLCGGVHRRVDQLMQAIVAQGATPPAPEAPWVDVARFAYLDVASLVEALAAERERVLRDYEAAARRVDLGADWCSSMSAMASETRTVLHELRTIARHLHEEEASAEADSLPAS